VIGGWGANEAMTNEAEARRHAATEAKNSNAEPPIALIYADSKPEFRINDEGRMTGGNATDGAGMHTDGAKPEFRSPKSESMTRQPLAKAIYRSLKLEVNLGQRGF
jgi:hypothetical protein